MKNYNINIVIFIFLVNTSNINAKDLFSKIEYGEMLYNNPRGVSCTVCHGEKGQGIKNLINFYISSENNRALNRVINGSNILKLSLKNFIQRLLTNKMLDKYRTNIMPNYYLNKEEIKLIYNFLHKRKKE